MKRFRHLSIAVLLLGTGLVVLPGGSQRSGLAEGQQPSPRTVTVLVGGGHDTIVLDSFFPRTVRARVGDTVVWKFNGDENHHLHTVTFSGGSMPGPKLAMTGGGPDDVLPGRWVALPGGQPGEVMRNPAEVWPTRKPGAPVETYDGTTFVNSGHMRHRPRVAGMPAAKEFSLKFTKPGIYRYACALHPHMQGTAEVVPASSADLPGQAEIDKQVKVESDHLLGLIEKARGLGKALRSEPGPNGTTFWFARAGVFDVSSEMRGQIFDFVPKNLTVKTGDTVIWESVDVHTITFNPTPPHPDPFIVRANGNDPPFVLQNPKVYQAFKPGQVYDPAQYFHSNILGMTTALGTSWALSFDKPGVYEYICALHEPMGMRGTITVVSK